LGTGDGARPWDAKAARSWGIPGYRWGSGFVDAREK